MPPQAPGNVETMNALSLETYQARLLGDDATLSTLLSDANKHDSQHEAASLRLRLSFTSSTAILAADFGACFHLIKASSMADYKNSSIKWSEAEKRREMRLPDLRYLLVRSSEDGSGTVGEAVGELSKDASLEDGGASGHDDQTGKDNSSKEPEDTSTDTSSPIKGFVSFMLTYEDGFEVLYIYEIHMAESLRGKGVGARLMGLVEEIARRAGMAKTMLTVFVSNGAARRFYEKLGYELDEFSPRPRKLRNGTTREPDYQILSKPTAVASEGRKKPRLDAS